MLHCSRTLQKNTVAYLLAADPTRPEEGGLVAGEQGKAFDVSNGQLGGVEVTSASDPQLFLGGSHSVRERVGPRGARKKLRRTQS